MVRSIICSSTLYSVEFYWSARVNIGFINLQPIATATLLCLDLFQRIGNENSIPCMALFHCTACKKKEWSQIKTRLYLFAVQTQS